MRSYSGLFHLKVGGGALIWGRHTQHTFDVWGFPDDTDQIVFYLTIHSPRICMTIPVHFNCYCPEDSVPVYSSGLIQISRPYTNFMQGYYMHCHLNGIYLSLFRNHWLFMQQVDSLKMKATTML